MEHFISISDFILTFAVVLRHLQIVNQDLRPQKTLIQKIH